MDITFSNLKKAIQYARQKKFDRHSSFYRPVVLAYATALNDPQPLSPPPEPKVKARIITNKARCKKCGEIVESKHRHDFNMCSCGSVFVDGGTDYMRRGGNLEHIEDMSEVEFLND